MKDGSYRLKRSSPAASIDLTEPVTILLVRMLGEPRAEYAARKTQRMFTDRDAEVLGRLPEGWTWAGMRQIGEVQLGRQRAPQHHAGDHMRPSSAVLRTFSEDRLDLRDVRSQ